MTGPWAIAALAARFGGELLLCWIWSLWFDAWLNAVTAVDLLY